MTGRSQSEQLALDQPGTAVPAALRRYWPVYVTFFVAAAIAVILHTQLWQFDMSDQDIYYIYEDSKRILDGENPYARIVGQDMRENQKYPTYFPLFYLLGALAQKAGLHSYPAWLMFWRPLFLGATVIVAFVLLQTLLQRGMPALALFAALFWLFNRWTLYLTEVGQIDVLPLLCLLLSLGLYPRRRYLALLLFSVSLALKQIGIVLLPAYLIWSWKTTRGNRARQVLLDAAIIASLPLLTSLPFLLSNTEGFLRSVVFSTTRAAQSHFPSRALENALALVWPGFTGVIARAPMLVLLGLIYAAIWQRRIGAYAGALLMFVTFVDFNSVLFLQYLVWVLPFIPLALSELWPAQHPQGA